MFLFVVDEHQQYKQQGEAKSPPNYNQDSLLPFFLDLVKNKKNRPSKPVTTEQNNLITQTKMIFAQFANLLGMGLKRIFFLFISF